MNKLLLIAVASIMTVSLNAQPATIILDEQKPLKPMYALVITTREPMIPASLATALLVNQFSYALAELVASKNRTDVLTKAIRNLMAERKKLQAELEYLRDILDIEGVEY